jgi:hypothetical protein
MGPTAGETAFSGTEELDQVGDVRTERNVGACHDRRRLGEGPTVLRRSPLQRAIYQHHDFEVDALRHLQPVEADPTEEAVTSFPPNDNGADGNWCWRRDDEHHSRPVLSMFS